MSNARLDFVDLSPDGIVVLQEQLSLFVESEQFFEPDVVVTFQAFFTDANGQEREITFSESLVATPGTPRNPESNLKASRIAWVANLNKGREKEAERSACTVIFTVKGVGQDGRRMVAPSSDKIIIQPVSITTDPRLTRIMVHEFFRPKSQPPGGDEDSFEFDPAPLQTFLDSLSPQQSKLLLNYPVTKPEGRLVVFITLYRQKPIFMRADYCDNGVKCARPNATFSVFHCQGPEKETTLVCHTEHFLVNLFNGRTQQWVQGPQQGKPAREWLKKSNPQPPRFRIGSVLPQKMCDGVIWSRIFTFDGKDIMSGNTMHGMINTVGCWMLFRNYNWPADKARAFDLIYRKIARAKRGRPAVEVALAKPENGYDAKEVPSAGLSSSGQKFGYFDMNFAYLWFFHDIVGIKYFSNRIDWIPKRAVNFFRAHGQVFFNAFPLDQVDKAPQFNLPDEGTFAYHDSDQRQKEDAAQARKLDPEARRRFKSFIPDNSLWRKNALGFQTAEGFLPQINGLFADLGKAQAEQFTWADMYAYVEDDVDITRLTTNYAEPGD